MIKPFQDVVIINNFITPDNGLHGVSKDFYYTKKWIKTTKYNSLFFCVFNTHIFYYIAKDSNLSLQKHRILQLQYMLHMHVNMQADDHKYVCSHSKICWK